MEYVYAALILHESDQEITEDRLTAVLEAAGVDVDQTRVKALVAALEDVDIEAAIQQPAGPTDAPSTAEPSTDEKGDAEAEAEAEEDTEEEEDEDEGPSGEGLGELFG